MPSSEKVSTSATITALEQDRNDSYSLAHKYAAWGLGLGIGPLVAFTVGAALATYVLSAASNY